jgi:hypothetical protein
LLRRRRDLVRLRRDLVRRPRWFPLWFYREWSKRYEYERFPGVSVVSRSEFGKGPRCVANFRAVFSAVSERQFLSHPNS